MIMSQDLLGEVKGCMEQYSNLLCVFVSLDTQTYTIHEFDPATLMRYMTLKPEGGGGTEFDCMFDSNSKKRTLFQKLIVFHRWLPGVVGAMSPTVILCLLFSPGYGGRTPSIA